MRYLPAFKYNSTYDIYTFLKAFEGPFANSVRRLSKEEFDKHNFSSTEDYIETLNWFAVQYWPSLRNNQLPVSLLAGLGISRDDILLIKKISPDGITLIEK